MEQNKKKILVLEDEKPLARALELKLIHEGFDVETGSNGENILETLKKSNFSLIVCDMLMPKIDGFQVLQILKDNNIKIPVIVLTNLSQAEDESTLRRALKIRLESEGFIIFEAKNGEEGLQLALSERPDLMIVDILMPRLDGLAMLQKLRETDHGKKVKFIILTNADSTEQIAKAMQVSGVVDDKTFDYYIKTDIKMEDVIEKIRNKLKS